MSQAFTRAMARNIFYGGSVVFLLLFLALSFDTSRALPDRDNRAYITGDALYREARAGARDPAELPKRLPVPYAQLTA